MKKTRQKTRDRLQGKQVALGTMPEATREREAAVTTVISVPLPVGPIDLRNPGRDYFRAELILDRPTNKRYPR